MPRYRVKIWNSPENSTELKFTDLLVKYSSGYTLPLSIREGDLVPTEILDPLDIQKSLIVGSLGRYLKAGFVIEELEPVSSLPVSLPSNLIEPVSQAMSSEEVSVPDPSIMDTSSLVPIVENNPSEIGPVPVPVPIDNLDQVKTPQDFLRLNFFLKLRFLKTCSDKGLLQSILPLIPDSKQLQNNIAIRLAQLS